MQLILKFDTSADILEVPPSIIEHRGKFKKRFLDWLYDERIHHKYWSEYTDKNGRVQKYVSFRGEALVFWLNEKVLKGNEEKAALLAEDVDMDECPSDLPSLFF
jgi:hypothetical protein